jgi:hypothetical protein
MLLGKDGVQLPIAWWYCRKMPQIGIGNDELRPSNLFAEYTRPDVEFEAACNVLCSRVWIFISPVMQVTSVCSAVLCVRSVDSSANTMFSKNLFRSCALFAMFTANICRSFRLLVVVTFFTRGIYLVSTKLSAPCI